jgi:hypothetical protein
MKIYANSFNVVPLASLLLVASQLESRKDIKVLSGVLLASVLVLILDAEIINSRILSGAIIFQVYIAPLALSLVLHGEIKLWKLSLLIIPFYPCKIILDQFLHPEGGQLMYRWVVMFASTFYILFFKSFKICVFAALILAIFVAIKFDNIISVKTQMAVEGAGSRFHEWQNALKLFVYWPLGIGVGNYADYSTTYSGKGLLELTTPHSQYIQLIAETGFVTLLVFLCFCFNLLKLGVSLYRTLSDEFLKAFILGATAVVFSQLMAASFGDHVLPAYHNAAYTRFGTAVYTWIYAGAILAVANLSRRESQTTG